MLCRIFICSLAFCRSRCQLLPCHQRNVIYLSLLIIFRISLTLPFSNCFFEQLCSYLEVFKSVHLNRMVLMDGPESVCAEVRSQALVLSAIQCMQMLNFNEDRRWLNLVTPECSKSWLSCISSCHSRQQNVSGMLIGTVVRWRFVWIHVHCCWVNNLVSGCFLESRSGWTLHDCQSYNFVRLHVMLNLEWISVIFARLQRAY
jgi:hypothetical protein